MRTFPFLNNKPAKYITMIQHPIIGIKNLGMTNGLVPSYLNKAYVDAFLSQAICDVFEKKLNHSKGMLFPVSELLLGGVQERWVKIKVIHNRNIWGINDGITNIAGCTQKLYIVMQVVLFG